MIRNYFLNFTFKQSWIKILNLKVLFCVFLSLFLISYSNASESEDELIIRAEKSIKKISTLQAEFTQISSVCVLHTNSFNIAKKTKKEAHLNISLSQPISSNLIEPPKNIWRKFLLKNNFPTNKPAANKIFIIVGFKYIKIGFLKKMVQGRLVVV